MDAARDPHFWFNYLAGGFMALGDELDLELRTLPGRQRIGGPVAAEELAREWHRCAPDVDAC